MQLLNVNKRMGMVACDLADSDFERGVVYHKPCAMLIKDILLLKVKETSVT